MFTGQPVLKKVTDNLFRLTGVSLTAGATGTIGFSEKTIPAEVQLVATQWQPYEHSEPGQAAPGVVSLQDSVQCLPVLAANNVAQAVPISVVKSGTTHHDFVIEVTNPNEAEGQASDLLEIWIEYGGH